MSDDKNTKEIKQLRRDLQFLYMNLSIPTNWARKEIGRIAKRNNLLMGG